MFLRIDGLKQSSPLSSPFLVYIGQGHSHSAKSLPQNPHLTPASSPVGCGFFSFSKISARNIAVGETYTCPELIGRVLEAGDFIQALGNGLSMDVSAFTQV